MKNFKILSIKLCMLLAVVTLTQCASGQKIENTKPPMQIKDPYYETWSSDTDSGFTIYIPVEENSATTLKHAYFKHRKITLIKETDTSFYVGKVTFPKKDGDLIMSSDPKEEYGNKLPAGIERIPFKLKDNECMIVFVKDGAEGHFKIENIPERKE